MFAARGAYYGTTLRRASDASFWHICLGSYRLKSDQPFKRPYYHLDLSEISENQAESDRSEISTNQFAGNEEVGQGRKKHHERTQWHAQQANQQGRDASRSKSVRDIADRQDEIPNDKKEHWQVQKAALESKFEKGWNPFKKLSPDAMDGIRALHAEDPERYSTPYLANQFEVSPEAIRRILKSKWRPTEKEAEDRRERWEKRGESVWQRWAELGYKPPKKWRDGMEAKNSEEVPKPKTSKRTSGASLAGRIL